MRSLLARAAGLSRVLRALVAFALVAAIGVLDALPEGRVSLAPLYVLPVAFAGWYLRLSTATLLAGIAAALPLVGLLVPRQAPPQPLLDAAVRLAAFAALVVSAAALRSAFDQARSDELTGIPGERAFAYGAAAELERARRYRRPLTVAYLDIDDFEQLNDRIGRAAGDAVLRSAANALRRMLRGADVVARVGDDEFALLLPETDFRAAQGALQKVLTNLPRALERGETTPTFCIGAVTFTSVPDAAEALLRNAEHQLHVAKKRGPGSLEHEVVGRSRG